MIPSMFSGVNINLVIPVFIVFALVSGFPVLCRSKRMCLTRMFDNLL
jgi:Ni/Fe-hydrogenase subunit HybB-like protein